MSIDRTTNGLVSASLLLGILLAGSAASGQAPSRGVASPPKTLAARLQGIEHVGMLTSFDGEQLDGYKLYVYSAEQQKRVSKQQAAYTRQLAESDAKINQLRVQLHSLRSSPDTSREEFVAVGNQLAQARRNRPIAANLEDQLTLHRVIEVGDDFIEVEALDSPEGTTIYPLGKLLQVTFVKDSVEPNE